MIRDMKKFIERVEGGRNEIKENPNDLRKYLNIMRNVNEQEEFKPKTGETPSTEEDTTPISDRIKESVHPTTQITSHNKYDQYEEIRGNVGEVVFFEIRVSQNDNVSYIKVSLNEKTLELDEENSKYFVNLYTFYEEYKGEYLET